MLRFDLAEIIRTPGMMQAFEIHEPPYQEEDVEFVAPVSGKVAVTNTGSLLLVRGPIHTVIELECSRCLEPVRVPIDVEIEEDFDLKVVEDASYHDTVLEIVEDEIGRVFAGKVLQLDVLIRQAALLDAPLQPLCREDCPGIPIRTIPVANELETYANTPFRDLHKLLGD